MIISWSFILLKERLFIVRKRYEKTRDRTDLISLSFFEEKYV